MHIKKYCNSKMRLDSDIIVVVITDCATIIALRFRFENKVIRLKYVTDVILDRPMFLNQLQKLL